MNNLSEKRKDIWECIKRVDTYISASNFKTALLLTFTFAIVAAAYNINILNPIENAKVISIILLLSLGISVFFTTFFALRAVFPQTQGQAESIYYFPGLTNKKEHELAHLKEFFLQSEETNDLDNLFKQYVDISKIACAKFNAHKIAVKWAQYGLLGSSVLLLFAHILCG